MREDYDRTFLIGRMNIATQTKITQNVTETYFRDNLLKLIKEGMYSDRIRKNLWVFENKGELLFEEEKVLYGIFGRVKEKGYENIFDMIKRKFMKEYFEKNIAQSYSFFIINPKTQIIIFEEKKAFKHKYFAKMFEKVYNDFYKSKSELTIALIPEESKLLKDLEKKKVLRIEFSLKPSNPEDEEDFRAIDTLLKKARARTAKIDIENKTEGLKFDESEGIGRQGVALSSAGYGDYKALVEQEGHTKTIHSKDTVLREVIPISNFSGEEVKRILKIFKKYLGREKNEKK